MNIKKIPTWKLEEIVRNNGVTDIGTDYEQYLDEINQVLWQRQNNQNTDRLKQEEKKRIEYEKYLDSILPPLPTKDN
jgi:hypothetical protein